MSTVADTKRRNQEDLAHIGSLVTARQARRHQVVERAVAAEGAIARAVGRFDPDAPTRPTRAAAERDMCRHRQETTNAQPLPDTDLLRLPR